VFAHCLELDCYFVIGARSPPGLIFLRASPQLSSTIPVAFSQVKARIGRAGSRREVLLGALGVRARTVRQAFGYDGSQAAGGCPSSLRSSQIWFMAHPYEGMLAAQAWREFPELPCWFRVGQRLPCTRRRHPGWATLPGGCWPGTHAHRLPARLRLAHQWDSPGLAIVSRQRRCTDILSAAGTPLQP
jgi:hypothetical protein